MGPLLFSAIIGIVFILCSSYLFYRWGWKAALILIPIIFIPFINGGYDKDFPSLIAPVILGGVGGIAFNTGRSLKFYILSSTLLLTFIFSGNFYYAKFHEKTDLFEDSKKIMLEMMKNYKMPQERINLINSDYDKFIKIANDLIPFSSFIYSLVLSSLAFLIMKLFFSRFEVAITGLEHFRLNDYIIFALIAGWTTFLLADKNKYFVLYLAGLNTALITSFLYLIQAVGIIKFFILKKGLPPMLLFLVLTLLLISGLEIIIFISIILIGFGALDLWADFRKFNVKLAK